MEDNRRVRKVIKNGENSDKTGKGKRLEIRLTGTNTESNQRMGWNWRSARQVWTRGRRFT